tara:strand:- start:1040 stop:1210 length:171 start_codon:yes stop_codon:yes gene_type:complete
VNEENQERFRNMVVYGVAATDDELGLTEKHKKKIFRLTMLLTIVVLSVLILLETFL